jgi:hypothetical protein
MKKLLHLRAWLLSVWFLAAHGTNLDGVWIRANEARLLNKGAIFKFGASSREYRVQLYLVQLCVMLSQQ